MELSNLGDSDGVFTAECIQKKNGYGRSRKKTGVFDFCIILIDAFEASQNKAGGPAKRGPKPKRDRTLSRSDASVPQQGRTPRQMAVPVTSSDDNTSGESAATPPEVLPAPSDFPIQVADDVQESSGENSDAHAQGWKRTGRALSASDPSTKMGTNSPSMSD
ncbi:chromobox 8 [Caerostris extrusa]|uniref:Chromobox 8 n=1 Tax=Caerostris extrusa TaxID=172846 RepID=A0AAV4S3U3_CAEEX|nr:chromobox 8 [Caerostris extrusa]